MVSIQVLYEKTRDITAYFHDFTKNQIENVKFKLAKPEIIQNTARNPSISGAKILN